jgi:hypothetical protein
MTDELKELIWEGWWQGYKLGYHVEEYTAFDRKVARAEFEKWWAANVD